MESQPAGRKMASPTLATATREQIQDAYKKGQLQRTTSICLLCNSTFSNKRTDAKFCSDTHRFVYHQLKKSLEKEGAQNEQQPASR